MISIIIPVYNTAPYIGKCVRSVKEQTLRDWECIIVNDGSTDNSLDKIDAAICNDKRFRVIDLKENQGISAARNAAIEVASGELLFYLDSDDWIDNLLLNRLCEVAIAHPDIGRITAPKIMHWPKYGWNLPCSIEPTGFHPADSPYLFTGILCDIGYATGNFYRRALLPELKFPKVVIFEDMLYNMGLLFAGVPIFITGIYGYHYERRDDSILSVNYTDEDAAIAQKVLADLAEKYNPKPELFERCKKFLTNSQNGKLGK